MNATALDPRIGQLAGGKFYAYVAGYQAEPTVGTLEAVEIALGLRAAPAKAARKEDRAYLVTMTPAVVMHAGSWAGTAYTVEILAKSAAAAITKARQERNAEEGRHAPRATYRARIK